MKPRPTARDLALCCLLALCTAAVYARVARHEFIHFDDDGYVSANEQVQDGLTWKGVVWAFTTTSQGNWHPLAWLSHMLDWQVCGKWAGGHHLTNLVLHIVSAVLLYLVLRRMTGAAWRSAAVAALFALHPLHVESAAWVAERKDVLSTMLGLLCLAAYVRYVAAKDKAQTARPAQRDAGGKRPKAAARRKKAGDQRRVLPDGGSRHSSAARWYALVVVLFVLALLAKPMLVTLPLVFLLLDYWPLGRLTVNGGGTAALARSAGRLVVEKAPLFVLAAVSCAITWYAQQTGGAVHPLPLAVRLGNALLAYVGYIEKMFWPAKLAVLYPHPAELGLWPPLAAGLVLLAISAACLWAGQRRPYLAVGWLWFLGMLVPVIGLVQVGGQAMADRYTYLPLVGLFLLIVWGAADLVARWSWGRYGLAATTLVVLIACCWLTWRQVGYWSDTVTLFSHSLEVTGPNPVALNILGKGYKARGDLVEAERQFRAAIAIADDYPDAHGNLGNLLAARREFKEAIAEYEIVLYLNPYDDRAHRQLGLAWLELGRWNKAEDCFREALRRQPGSTAHASLAVALQQGGKTGEALEHYRESLRLRPGQPEPLNNLAWILATHPDGRFRNGAEAIALAQQAAALTGRSANTLDTLAAAYAEAGRFPEAVAAARESLTQAEAAGQGELVPELKSHLADFEAGRPYRDGRLIPRSSSPPPPAP